MTAQETVTTRNTDWNPIQWNLWWRTKFIFCSKIQTSIFLLICTFSSI